MLLSKIFVSLIKPLGFSYVLLQYKSSTLAKIREISWLAYYSLTKKKRILVAYTKNHPRMNVIANNAPDTIIYTKVTQNYKNNILFNLLLSKIDVIYQDGMHSVSVKNNKPRVLEFEHRYFKQALIDDVNIKKIFVMSHSARPKLVDPEDKIEILYPTFPIQKYTDRPKSSKKLTIFMSGADAARKGADILFKAFENIEEKLAGQYKLNLIMAANYRKNTPFYRVTDKCMERTRRAYKKSRLKSNVIFSPVYPPSVVNHFYRRADIYVIPTRYDTPGMSILEAMSFGLPVVTTNITAIPELVIHEYNGYLIDVKDYDLRSEAYYDYAVIELEKYLTELIVDAELRREMGNNSLQRMRETLSFEYKKQRLEETFMSIVGKTRDEM